MKLEMQTMKLNSILSNIAKGVGNVRVLPITEYLEIELLDGELTFRVTDSINFMTYKEKGFEGDNGRAVVRASQFIDLASKTTKAEIKLELKEKHLEFIGNGVYKIELNTEDDFPTYTFDRTDKGVEIDAQKLKSIFKTNSSAIAEDMLMPCLTGYNLGTLSTTTDGVKMCINDEGITLEDEVLISQKQAELINDLTGDKITVHKVDNKLLFETDHVEIFGVEMDDKESYPDITSFAELEGDNKATVNRKSLIDSLERLALFVNIFENGGVTLNFTAEELQLWDIKENSKESVTYQESEITDVASVSVSVRYLIDLVRALESENIELQYTNDSETPLIIKDGKVVQLLSVMEEAK